MGILFFLSLHSKKALMRFGLYLSYSVLLVFLRFIGTIENQKNCTINDTKHF